jgi:DNA-binding NarL/FixJ family response regulator
LSSPSASIAYTSWQELLADTSRNGDRVPRGARAGRSPARATIQSAATAPLVDNRGVPTSSGTADMAPEVRPPPRVVLADDDVLLREGLAGLLARSGFDVVGQAGDGRELLALVRATTPDVAIIDIRMPPAHATEGLGAARVIRAELPDTAIIVLSAHVEVDEAMELLAGGERLGYLLKSRVTTVAEFIDTVERIVAGASIVDPSLVQELIRARRRRDPLDTLSVREREVLALMAEGGSNAGIARRIFVAEGTVEKHVRSILTKLDLPESATDHRRVLAVLKFLEAR